MNPNNEPIVPRGSLRDSHGCLTVSTISGPANNKLTPHPIGPAALRPVLAAALNPPLSTPLPKPFPKNLEPRLVRVSPRPLAVLPTEAPIFPNPLPSLAPAPFRVSPVPLKNPLTLPKNPPPALASEAIFLPLAKVSPTPPLIFLPKSLNDLALVLFLIQLYLHHH